MDQASGGARCGRAERPPDAGRDRDAAAAAAAHSARSKASVTATSGGCEFKRGLCEANKDTVVSRFVRRASTGLVALSILGARAVSPLFAGRNAARAPSEAGLSISRKPLHTRG